MKMNKAMLYVGAMVYLALFLTGCRSRQEAAGDKFRKVGNPINALMQYEQALARGKLSKEFYKNYTLVNIQAMTLRAKEDPNVEFMDVLKDTVANLLRNHPDAENEALFTQALREIGQARIERGNEEGGFRFLIASEGMGGKPSSDPAVAAIRAKFLQAKLKEIEGDLKDAASEPTSGILADYKMNKLALVFGKEVPEMKELWSRIRKFNLNTYLMYDYEGLIPDLDARINKYGALLAIVKLEPGATSLKAQVKAYNGTSGPITVDGNGFTLVDREGNVHKPSGKIGAFSKPAVIGKGEESKTGGLTFSYPAGTEPHYIELKTDVGITRKYLP